MESMVYKRKIGQHGEDSKMTHTNVDRIDHLKDDRTYTKIRGDVNPRVPLR